jgi:hypothetical protein
VAPNFRRLGVPIITVQIDVVGVEPYSIRNSHLLYPGKKRLTIESEVPLAIGLATDLSNLSGEALRLHSFQSQEMHAA